MSENYSSSDSGRCELFAAANSGRGFRSFYREIFGEGGIERRYLIKGGPGTGKSSFMRQVAELSAKRGAEVEYYRCSSDPESLDGIVLDRRIAVFDATAPHAEDPDLCGARDEIVDLGVFWDADALFSKRAEIESLCAKKKEEYALAYKFLEAALAVSDASHAIAAPIVKLDKLRRAVRRTLSCMPDGDGYSLMAGLVGSIGMKGVRRLDYYERRARRLVAIEDFMGIGGLYLLEVAREGARKQRKLRISYDPIDTSLPDAILFEDDLTAFVLAPTEDDSEIIKKADTVVRCRRFADMSELGLRERNERKRIRSDYRSAVRLREALCDSAAERMRRAGELHFELEKIYGEAMDFSALSRFCRSMAERICGYLKKSEEQ